MVVLWLIFGPDVIIGVIRSRRYLLNSYRRTPDPDRQTAVLRVALMMSVSRWRMVSHSSHTTHSVRDLSALVQAGRAEPANQEQAHPISSRQTSLTQRPRL